MKTFIYIDHDTDSLKFGTLVDLYKDYGDWGVFVLNDRSKYMLFQLHYWQVFDKSMEHNKILLNKKIEDNKNFREKAKNGEVWATA